MRLPAFFASLLCLLMSSEKPAQAQLVAVGVKAGVRTTSDVSGFSLQSAESQRYTLGPMVELRLPLHLGVEFDALYRRFGYTSNFASCCGSSVMRERSNSWEFPIIAKYHLPAWRVQPFVGVGYAPRTVSGSVVSSGSFLSGMTSNPPTSVYTYYFNQHSGTHYPITHGLVVSAGLDLGAKHFRISPELRYVHWNQPFLTSVGGDGSYFLQSSQDELFVLFGFSWR
ncbi:MAG TPA: hypothetical protein VGN17_08580 [Bryobacteraceae bacterium]|jgi:hypothetical protein